MPHMTSYILTLKQSWEDLSNYLRTRLTKNNIAASLLHIILSDCTSDSSLLPSRFPLQLYPAFLAMFLCLSTW